MRNTKSRFLPCAIAPVLLLAGWAASASAQQPAPAGGAATSRTGPISGYMDFHVNDAQHADPVRSTAWAPDSQRSGRPRIGPVTQRCWTGLVSSATSKQSESKAPVPTASASRASSGARGSAWSRSTTAIGASDVTTARTTRSMPRPPRGRYLPESRPPFQRAPMGRQIMVRQIKIARDTAVKARSAAIITLKTLIVNAPDALRETLGRSPTDNSSTAAPPSGLATSSTRPRP